MNYSDATHLRCCTCKETKVSAEFYPNARGYSKVCKPCAKAWSHKQAESGYFRKRRMELATKRTKGDKANPRTRTRLTDIERTARDLVDNVRKRAVRHGWECSITRQWVENAVREFAENNYCEFTTKSPFKPSIDRLDSKKTYEVSNLRVCWMIENYARNTFTDEQVLEFCRRKLGLQ